MSAGVGVLLLVSACGGVDVPQPQRADCAALVRALPQRLSDQPRREVDDRYAASWGDPAIVLRCGVPEPKAREDDPFAPCQTVDGVDWFAPESAAEDQSATVTLTTIGRVPRVDLTVPAQYRPPTGALVDAAEAIKAHSRSTRPCS